MDLKTLFQISYGLYVVSSAKDGKKNGQIANTVFQVTSDPAAVAVCLNKKNLTSEFVSESKKFAVAILDIDSPMTLIGRFGFKSGRDINKFENIKSEETGGVPVLTENTTGYFICDVINQLDAGTHLLFIGKVIEAKILSDKKQMTYAYYHQVKNGKEPPTAPTYLKTKI